MSLKPTLKVFSIKGEVCGNVELPSVMSVVVRPDLVRYVHTNMSKNARTAYAVSPGAGYQTSAESWGTGRAVARIPRVSGGGTHRAGQAAFGNMCRGGGMYSPTKIYRRWHRKINLTEKRHAVASALSAASSAQIVSARGHKIDDLPQIPLIIDDSIKQLTKTKDALGCLKALGCAEELKKIIKTKHIRSGVRKSRNLKYKIRKGPLVVHNFDKDELNAFRNIPGVELANVKSLNLMKIAPGGTLGRLIIFTKSAFEELENIYTNKKGYFLPRGVVTIQDIHRVINSDEIQSVLRPKKEGSKPKVIKLNPLKNKKAAEKLAIKV